MQEPACYCALQRKAKAIDSNKTHNWRGKAYKKELDQLRVRFDLFLQHDVSDMKGGTKFWEGLKSGVACWITPAHSTIVTGRGESKIIVPALLNSPISRPLFSSPTLKLANVFSAVTTHALVTAKNAAER